VATKNKGSVGIEDDASGWQKAGAKPAKTFAVVNIMDNELA